MGQVQETGINTARLTVVVRSHGQRRVEVVPRGRGAGGVQGGEDIAAAQLRESIFSE